MQRKAFTLIELMVVVLIVGIISAAAVPSMQKTMDLNRGTDAIGVMIQLSTAQKRCRLNNITDQDGQCRAEVLSSTHYLVVDGYYPNMDWANAYYSFGAASSSSCPTNKRTFSHSDMESCTSVRTIGSPAFYASEGECKKEVGRDYCPNFGRQSSGSYGS